MRNASRTTFLQVRIPSGPFGPVAQLVGHGLANLVRIVNLGWEMLTGLHGFEVSPNLVPIIEIEVANAERITFDCGSKTYLLNLVAATFRQEMQMGLHRL